MTCLRVANPAAAEEEKEGENEVMMVVVVVVVKLGLCLEKETGEKDKDRLERDLVERYIEAHVLAGDLMMALVLLGSLNKRRKKGFDRQETIIRT